MTVPYFVLVEAVSSVALSHAEDCGCLTCRAADGDERALAEVWRAVERLQAEREASA